MTNAITCPEGSVPSVMVSSTFADLKEHRAELITALHSLGLYANAMENDGALLKDVVESSLQKVKNSSAYIGIIGRRYGQVPECDRRNPNRLSITELEFNEAQSLGRPILLFVMGDEHTGTSDDLEKDPDKVEKLNAFRERAKLTDSSSRVQRVYAVFDSLSEFRSRLLPSLLELKHYLESSEKDMAREARANSAEGQPISSRQRQIGEMELQLLNALEAYKGQPVVFLEPKLSKKREFNDDPNELHHLLENPKDTLIVAPPEFGLTCLGLHLQVEACRQGSFYLYVDAEKTKGRKVVKHIEERLLHFNSTRDNLRCIVLDSWNAGKLDHLAIVKNIASVLPGLPLVILAEDSQLIRAGELLAGLKRQFELLHLQALSKNSMRQLVASYNSAKNIGTEDLLVSSVAAHLESINIHRTPLNCYTLLRVLDSSYSEALLNKSKLLKSILFVLFTDHTSFFHLNSKPEVEECAYIMGHFCKDLIKEARLGFNYATFTAELKEVCRTSYIVLDVDALIEVLIENKILIRQGSELTFRHRFWVFYFAAEWMRHDDAFKQFIFKDRNYVNYPEVMEFYAGIDGQRSDAIETLLSDLTNLISEVERKIGIASSFDPLSALLWNPSDEFVRKVRSQIAEKVGPSNLPAHIKDKHADSYYESVAPYDQGINQFLHEYSVLSLLGGINAASRALRSSPFVEVSLKVELANAILQGWEEVSRVVFWLSPMLAREGRAIHDGFALRLADGFSKNFDQRSKEILTSNPSNVVAWVGDDLASKKIGPLLNACVEKTDSMLQKHMVALFFVKVRPEGWRAVVRDYINYLHPRSYYLGDLFEALTQQAALGDLQDGEEAALKELTRAVLSKREYAPKSTSDKPIPAGDLFSERNALPRDQLLKGNRQPWRPR